MIIEICGDNLGWEMVQDVIDDLDAKGVEYLINDGIECLLVFKPFDEIVAQEILNEYEIAEEVENWKEYSAKYLETLTARISESI